MFELFLDNRALIQNMAAVVLFAAACWRGGAPERLCAGVLFGMVVADFAYHALAGSAELFSQFDLWHFTLDSAGLAALVAIALHANRFYPLVLAATQLVSFTSHIVRALVEPVSSLAYYLLYNTPFWFELIILAIAIVRHASRSRDHDRYRDWREKSAAGPSMRYS